MKRDPLLKHDPSFVDKAPAVALNKAARVLAPTAAEWLYSAPLWLPTSHAQTIVPALFGRKPAVLHYRRERWSTPDGDFIDLDYLAHEPGDEPAASAPLFVFFHGLEGNSDSHYARTMMAAAKRRAALPQLQRPAQSAAALLSPRRRRGGRLNPAAARAVASRADRGSGRLARRQRAAALAVRARHGCVYHQRGGRHLGAARCPRGRRGDLAGASAWCIRAAS